VNVTNGVSLYIFFLIAVTVFQKTFTASRTNIILIQGEGEALLTRTVSGSKSTLLAKMFLGSDSLDHREITVISP
jgi:hypothetical protein